jgi:hypothetical protein
MSVSVAIWGSEKSHVPPASHAYPSRQRVMSSATDGRFTSVIVFKFIGLSGWGGCPRGRLSAQ